jgi:hypothetical protein
LEADIKLQTGVPQLTILIHGLATLFDGAIHFFSLLGNGLQHYAPPASPYEGLVIAFDWPSYGEVFSEAEYASSQNFPPQKTSGTIRDNINGSTQAFLNLLTMIQTIRGTIPDLQVNLVCHSEGNYMLMLGMYALNQAGQLTDVTQTLMLAADINNGALQLLPAAGRGDAIAKNSSQVTVYYTTDDTVLSGSEIVFAKYHDSEYLGRLGLEGPASYLTDALQPNVIGLDCSAVLNPQATQGIVPVHETMHTAYFYVPQVISDIAQTLNGVSASSVTNRISGGQEDGQGYVMQLDTSQPVMDVRMAAAQARSVRASAT